MSDQLPPVQEQSAPQEQTPQTSAPAPQGTVSEIQDRIFAAKLAHAGPEAIQNLESQLAAALSPAPQEPAPAPVEPNEQQQQVTETVATEEPPAPEGEVPPEPTVEPADRIRIGSYSEEDQALVNAAHILAKSGKMTFKEAFARVSGLDAPKAAEPEPEQSEPQLPPALVAAQEEVDELEAQLDAAAEAADQGVFDKGIAEITKKLMRANAKLESQQRQHEQQTSVKGEVDDAMFEQQREGVLHATVRDYPQMRDKESVQWMIAKQMAEAAQDTSHPDHDQLFKLGAPRYFADKAAAKLGIKPSGAPSTPSPQKASSPASQPSQPKPAPQSGARQTVPQPQVTAQDIVKLGEDKLAAVLSGRAGTPKNNTPQRVIFLG